MFSFSAINLGCSKNMVDLEYAIGEILKFSDRAPIEYIEDPESRDCEYVIVNTCGFLSSAREESEETLAYYDSLGKKLILMGCYVSVKDDAFLAGLKNLHSIVPFMSYSVIEELVLGKKSKFNLSAIVRAKQAHKESKEKTLTRYLESIEAPGKDKKAFVWRGDEVRAYMHAPFGYEYLKIAEGCDNNCTFCIIPTIRGRQTSRPIESIVEEVKVMLSQGIQEIQILSQDTTRYGTDIYGEPKLMDLLRAIDETIEAYLLEKGGAESEGRSGGLGISSPLIRGDKGGSVSEHQSSVASRQLLSQGASFRVYYLYPDILTLSHIDELAKLKHFLPYFDIPFQHASESVLKLMGRHYDRAHIDAFLDKIRNTEWQISSQSGGVSVPSPFSEGEGVRGWGGAFIRTAFIIGFPGETDTDFEILKDFVRKYEFESVGIFQYHDEPLAASSKLPNKVDDDIAKNRIRELNSILEDIYTKKREERVGKKQVGYIMEILHPNPLLKERGSNSNSSSLKEKGLGDEVVIIRPELHAPEVDEYDEVAIGSIEGRIEIGGKVSYLL